MNEPAFSHSAYQQFLEEHKLMASRCQSCGALHLPPRPLCPACHGQELQWVELSGQGTLTAFTTIHIVPSAMLEAGYGRENPYCSGIVALAEGPSVSAQIVGMDSGQPEQIKLGTPLVATYVRRGEGDDESTYLAFKPV